MRSNGHRRNELSARIERLNDVTRLVVWLLLVVGGVVAACQRADQGATVTTDRQDATSTTIGDATCVDPPDSELEVDSPLDLTVEPNPVAAGGSATLSIGRGELPENSNIGAGAAWQCWKGTAWVDTHQIVRAFAPGYGEAIAVVPGVDTTIPAVGLEVPSSYPIKIPEVASGTYRIVDDASGPGGTVTGFVIVEVIED